MPAESLDSAGIIYMKISIEKLPLKWSCKDECANYIVA